MPLAAIGVRCPRTGITGSCELSGRYWPLNCDPLVKQFALSAVSGVSPAAHVRDALAIVIMSCDSSECAHGSRRTFQ